MSCAAIMQGILSFRNCSAKLIFYKEKYFMFYEKYFIKSLKIFKRYGIIITHQISNKLNYITTFIFCQSLFIFFIFLLHKKALKNQGFLKRGLSCTIIMLSTANFDTLFLYKQSRKHYTIV